MKWRFVNKDTVASAPTQNSSTEGNAGNSYFVEVEPSVFQKGRRWGEPKI